MEVEGNVARLHVNHSHILAHKPPEGPAPPASIGACSCREPIMSGTCTHTGLQGLEKCVNFYEMALCMGLHTGPTLAQAWCFACIKKKGTRQLT